MGHYRQLLLFLFAQSFVLNCDSYVHQEFKTLSHSKLHELYSKHYGNYKKFVAKYKEGVKDDRPEPHRLLAFAKSVEDIKRHNELYKQGKSSFMLGLTPMSDLTMDDLKLQFPVIKFNDSEYPVQPNLTRRSVKEVSWASKKYMTKVKDFRCDEGCFCGGAASSVADLVTALAAKSYNRKVPDLSMQELIDCSGSGCNSHGDFNMYAQYILRSGGLVTDKAYPYVRQEQQCLARGVRYGRNSKLKIYGGPSNFKALLEKGPVATRILITDKSKNYVGGVYRERCMPHVISHTVLAVGFKDDYVMLKGSFGKEWGEKGYMRISADSRENCNIYSEMLGVS